MAKTEGVKRFYSVIDEAIKTLKQSKGTGEQMLQQLKQVPGVKKEELELRGIEQYLKSQPKITKEEIEKYLQSKPAPEIKVIEKSTTPPDITVDVFKAESKVGNAKLERLEKLGFEVQPTATGSTLLFRRPGYPGLEEWQTALDVRRVLRKQAQANPNISKEELDVIDDIHDLAATSANKFATIAADIRERAAPKFNRPELQTPGGKNYRERLLQIRQADKPEGAGFYTSHWGGFDDIMAHVRTTDRIGPGGEKILFVEEIQSDWHQLARKARARLINDQLVAERDAIRQQAISSLSPDQLTMTTANEKRLKDKIEELTSARRKQLEKEIPTDAGYRTPDDEAKLEDLKNELHRIRTQGLNEDELAEYFTPGKIVESYGGYDKVLGFYPGLKVDSPEYKAFFDNKVNELLSKGELSPAEAQIVAKYAADTRVGNWNVEVIAVNPKTGEPLPDAKPRRHATGPEDVVKRKIDRQIGRLESKVPDVPFKKSWAELAVKDILDVAAREGYDQVQFAPAATQIQRYNMANFVDSIRIGKMPDNTYVVEGISGGQPIVSHAGISKNNLADYVGREQAEQFFRDNEEFGTTKTTLSGADLQLGGKEAAGMRKFYDEMLPKATADYLKKDFGIEPISMPVGRPSLTYDQAYDQLMMNTPDRIHAEAETRAQRNFIQQHGRRPVRGTAADEPFMNDLTMDAFYELVDDEARRMASEASGKTAYHPTFTVPITPAMREQITTRGQRLFAVPPAVGAGMLPQEETEPTEEPQTESLPFGQPVQQFKEAGKVEKQERTLSDSPFNESKRVQPKSLVSSAKDATRFLTGEQQTAQNIASKRIGENVEAGRGTVEYLVDMLVPQTPSEVALEAAFGPVSRPIRKVLLGMAASGYEPEAEAAKLRAFHGGVSRLEELARGQPLWVATDPAYAAKRGQDKMRTRTDVIGPPAVTPVNIETDQLLMLKQKYTPEEVDLARKALAGLPSGQPMTGEQIYEAAKGSGTSKAVSSMNMDRVARAMNKQGYEVPPGVADAGEWYKIIDQTEGVELPKKRGGRV